MSPGTAGEWEVEVKRLLERYPEVDVLQEIYQVTHKLNRFGTLSQGMALEWIKLTNVLGGEDQFRRLSNSNWDSFHATQSAITHRKRCLQDVFRKIMDRGRTLVEQVKKKEDELNDAIAAGRPAAVQQVQEQQEALAFQQATFYQLFDEYRAKAGEVYTNMVWRSVGYLKRFESIGIVALNHVGLEIQRDQGAHPACYLVNLGVEREIRPGPTIAIHADAAPRLLDANTCEFQFYSRNTFNQFLVAYWKLYGRYGYPESSRTEILRLAEDNGRASKSAEDQMDAWVEKAWHSGGR